MSNILQALGRDAKAVEKWFAEAFVDIKTDIAPVLVSVIEAVRTAETDGILPAIANALSPLTKGLSVEVNNKIIAGIPGALAVALGIEGLPTNPTAAQVTAFCDAAVTAIAGKEADVKGSAYTTTVGQFYILIETSLESKIGLTVGAMIEDVEEAYADLEQNIADQAA
jgi:hypothetical protein